MEQCNRNQTPQTPPKHNIFSSEIYSIGRLEFLGCSVLIVLLTTVVQYIVIRVLAIAIDGVTAINLSKIVWAALTWWLFSFNYSHRLFHIGWTDEMNSNTYGGLLALTIVVGACVPIINIPAGLFGVIAFVVLVAVPGGNE